MVHDADYHPQFRQPADVRLFPQSDGNLAASGAHYVGDLRMTSTFRVSTTGVVLNDDGPRDTAPPRWTLLRMPDGRRVEAVQRSSGSGFVGTGREWFAFITTSADGTKLSEIEVEAVTAFAYDGPPPPPYNSVKLVPLPDGRVLAGGNFTGGGLMRIEVDGTLGATFDSGTDWFRDLVILPDGSAVIARGGTESSDSFLTVVGPAELRRIRADGTVDPVYTTTLEDPTLHLVLADGRILAGESTLIRLLSDGSPDPGFAAPAGFGLVLNVLRLADGRLMVEYGANLETPRVALLSADGALLRDYLSLFPGSTGVALDGIDIRGDAWLRHGPLARVWNAPNWRSSGGRRVSFDHGSSNARIAVTGPDAVSAAPVGIAITPRPTKSGTVEALQFDGAGRMVVGGLFESVEGQPRQSVARFNADGSLDTSFAPTGVTGVACVHPDGCVLARTGTSAADRGYRRLLSDGTFDPAFPADSALAVAKEIEGLRLDAVGNYVAVTRDPNSERAFVTEIRRYAKNGTLQTRWVDLGGDFILWGLAVLDDGRLIVGGSNRVAVQNGYRYSLAVHRLLADGTRDPDFRLDLPDGSRIESLQVMPDGRVLAAVNRSDNLSPRTITICLRADGTVDPAFRLAPEDEEPVARYPLPDGGFLGRGPAASNYVVCRWARDGRRDPSFSISQTALPPIIVGPNGAWYGRGGSNADRSILSPIGRYVPVHESGMTLQPADQQHIAGGTIFLQAGVGDAGEVTYQWQRDGVDVVGATGPRLIIDHARPSDSGFYQCIVRAGSTTYTTLGATVTVAANTAKIVNFSARSRVEPGLGQIGGMVVDSPDGQPALLRAIGSALPFNLGVPLLHDPVLTLFDRSAPIASDRGGIWRAEILALGDQLGAFRPRVPVPEPDDPLPVARNSALATTLASGLFTAHTTSGDGGSGVSLFEYYDASPGGSGPGIRNISVRGVTGPGADVLIAGFVVKGTGNIRLLIRAIGPSLSGFGVQDWAADPRVIIRRSGTYGPDATNDNWAGSAAIAAEAEAVGAFPIPADSKDAALVLSVPAGAYTIQVPAADGQRGEVLTEIYVLEP